MVVASMAWHDIQARGGEPSNSMQSAPCQGHCYWPHTNRRNEAPPDSGWHKRGCQGAAITSCSMTMAVLISMILGAVWRSAGAALFPCVRFLCWPASSGSLMPAWGQ